MKHIVITTIFILCILGSSAYATSHPHAYGGIPSDGTFIEHQGYIM